MSAARPEERSKGYEWGPGLAAAGLAGSHHPHTLNPTFNQTLDRSL
jgi:hypothetical protein